MKFKEYTCTVTGLLAGVHVEQVVCIKALSQEDALVGIERSVAQTYGQLDHPRYVFAVTKSAPVIARQYNIGDRVRVTDSWKKALGIPNDPLGTVIDAAAPHNASGEHFLVVKWDNGERYTAGGTFLSLRLVPDSA